MLIAHFQHALQRPAPTSVSAPRANFGGRGNAPLPWLSSQVSFFKMLLSDSKQKHWPDRLASDGKKELRKRYGHTLYIHFDLVILNEIACQKISLSSALVSSRLQRRLLQVNLMYATLHFLLDMSLLLPLVQMLHSKSRMHTFAPCLGGRRYITATVAQTQHSRTCEASIPGRKCQISPTCCAAKLIVRFLLHAANWTVA